MMNVTSRILNFFSSLLFSNENNNDNIIFDGGVDCVGEE